jgi:nitrite reductase/ring-hydroxylating ferredoxin subunit
MTIQTRKGTRVISFFGKLLVAAFMMLSCKSDLSDDAIPFVAFADLVINLSAPEFQPLAVNGGFKDIGSIGVRGVFVYRRDAGTYIAYERNCSYHPNEACATVNVHSSNLYLVDPCCNSTFSFTDGSPTGGIAWRPLRIYTTSLMGTQLTITDEIAN